MINFINRFHVKDDEERLYVESPAPYETNTFFFMLFVYSLLVRAFIVKMVNSVVYGGSQRFVRRKKSRLNM